MSRPRWIDSHAFAGFFRSNKEAFILRNYDAAAGTFELHDAFQLLFICQVSAFGLSSHDFDAHLRFHELLTGNVDDGYVRDFEEPFPLSPEAARILMAAFPGRNQYRGLADSGPALLYLPKGFGSTVKPGSICLAVVPLDLSQQAAIFRSNAATGADQDLNAALQMFRGLAV